MEIYFVISNSDGDTTVRQSTKEMLTRDINDGSFGSKPIFLSGVPDEHDTNYWGENVFLIIKGEVVVPEPVTKVTQYKIK